jgi:arabinose-5-phosphate isomerase
LSDNIKKIAIDTIKTEWNAIGELVNFIDDEFEKIVQEIYNSKGRLIITGIGKSAIIGQKIVATLNSTGTPSIFMHAADAVHGDLGIIQKDDVVIAISKSGNTPEIKVLVPILKKYGNTLIAMVGNKDSALGNGADYIINTSVEVEACPNNLAPTTSTTAQLVMGDALAVTLLSMKNFSSGDFSKYHPGGSLGKQLYLTAGDLAESHDKPLVKPDASIKEVILEISSKRLGATVVSDNGNILGIVTDGDIRRMLDQHDDLSSLTASDIMSPDPKTINKGILAKNCLSLFTEKQISQIIVVDDDGSYKGMVHFHDLSKEGINT